MKLAIGKKPDLEVRFMASLQVEPGKTQQRGAVMFSNNA